jgi:hypothetical protein
MSRIAVCFAGIALGGLTVPSAQAGMTSYTLNEVVRLRMEDISFFGLLLLLCATGFLLTWNYVARGIPFLPKLNFLRALCLTGVLSLLMLLVLSMISGARELLTPGVWRRQGTGYRLNEIVSEPLRRQHVLYLKAALDDYARQHEGRMPPHDFVPEIPEKMWLAPGGSSSRYLYFAPLGSKAGSKKAADILLCEPEALGDMRFVLLRNGDVAQMTTEKIRATIGLKP